MGAYQLAQEDFSAGVARAAEQNVDADMYGQALIWEVLKMYTASGRSPADIRSEIQFTLDNYDDDDPILHVSRN